MRSIFIEARQWHDTVNGNSYYSAAVYIDGEHVFSTGMSYGYEYQYEYDVTKELVTRRVLPVAAEGRGVRRYCRENGIDFYSVRYDTRKRDLFKKEN